MEESQSTPPTVILPEDLCRTHFWAPTVTRPVRKDKTSEATRESVVGHS